MTVKSVTVLGATGSVGSSTLDLIRRTPEQFQVVALTAQTRVDELATAAINHGAKIAVIGEDKLYRRLKDRLSGTRIEAASGTRALEDAGALSADVVVAAMTGAAGLRPAMAAVAQGRRIALANKECLVTAGALFMSAVEKSGAELLPVDSEHSAVLQALGDASSEHIERIVLTASGGPFRTWAADTLAAVTPEQALKHPNWSMGPKITIDSATMMNKGLELIEAFHLFPVEAGQLDVLVHPQSIIHALVEYCDGSVMAQLASPDMRTPIALALSWPGRMRAPTARLDLAKLGTLTFEAPDRSKFPAIALAEAALRRGGVASAVLNAANEVAVEAFLDRRVGFLDIARTVELSLNKFEGSNICTEASTLDEVLDVDYRARALARDVIATFR